MRYFENHVPSVISALEDKVRMKGSRTFIPPAFFGRDGILVQPPAFEMPNQVQEDEDFTVEQLKITEEKTLS